MQVGACLRKAGFVDEIQMWARFAGCQPETLSRSWEAGLSVPGASSCRAERAHGASPRASPTFSATVFPALAPPRVPGGARATHCADWAPLPGRRRLEGGEAGRAGSCQGVRVGEAVTPSVVTLVPSDYLSALQLQVHPQPVPLDSTFSGSEIPEPSVWAAGGGGHFGTPWGLLTHRGCLVGAHQCEAGAGGKPVLGYPR